MAVTAPASKVGRQNAWIVVVMCVVFGAYFLYDGWASEAYQGKHLKKLLPDGRKITLAEARQLGKANPGEFRPDANLGFNRYWGPGICLVGAVYFLIAALRSRSVAIVADEKGLTLADGQTIDYQAVGAIDKRFFEKEGHFTVSYQRGQTEDRVKLSTRKYDNLPALLDELVKRTGAAPAASDDQAASASQQPGQ